MNKIHQSKPFMNKKSIKTIFVTNISKEEINEEIKEIKKEYINEEIKECFDEEIQKVKNENYIKEDNKEKNIVKIQSEKLDTVLNLVYELYELVKKN